MAKAPPSFDFYYNDWIGGTKHLSHVARSCYLDLLMFQFQNGAIPERKLAMMQLCGITDQGQWDSIWDEIKDKFEPIDDARRGNVKMDETREKAIRRWEANRVNGRRPKRKPDGSQTEATAKPSLRSGLSQTEATAKPSLRSGLSQTEATGKEEEGSRKKEERRFQEEDLKTTHTHRTELNDSRRAVSNQTRFSDEPVERETAFKAPGSPPPAISHRTSTPVSTESAPNALAGIVGVRGKPKPTFFTNPDRPCLAELMVGSQLQTVNIPKSHATERCAKAVQQWIDYCDGMGKLPQIMSLEQQLVDCANKNRSEDAFVEAIKRTIRDNCDPQMFRPKIWSQELKFGLAKVIEDEPQYLTPAQLRAGGAI